MPAQALVGADDLLVFYAPSGEYPNYSGTGFWIGQVQEVTFDQNEGRETIKYVAGAGGGQGRNIDSFIQGKRDYTGTIRYYPQGGNLFGFAIGSMSVAGGSLYTGVETGGRIYWGGLGLFNGNPNSTTGLLRNLSGFTIDRIKLSGRQGEPCEVEINYSAGSITNNTAGTKPSVTVDTQRTPYMWDNCQIIISGGTAYTDILHPVLEFSWELNNNLYNPFYCDNTQYKGESIPQGRDYTIDLTLHMTQTSGAALYDKLFFGGSEFITVINLVRTANSDQFQIICSGCKMTAMEIPLPLEGPIEQTCTIIPQTCSLRIVDSGTTAYPNWSLAK